MASSEPFSAGDPPSPPAGGWRPPRPRSRDQTLASYIADGDFSRHQARLDRENAHLILSEAVIQATTIARFERRIRVPVSQIPSVAGGGKPFSHAAASASFLSQKFTFLDSLNERGGSILIGSPPRPSTEQQGGGTGARENGGELSDVIRGASDSADLELLSEKLRNLETRVSPRRATTTTTTTTRVNRLASNSTHHHPLLPNATSFSTHAGGSQVSGSPIFSEEEEEEDAEEEEEEADEDEDDEILATLSPPSEPAGRTSPFPRLLGEELVTGFDESDAAGAAAAAAAAAAASSSSPTAMSLAREEAIPSARRGDTSAETLALTLLGATAASDDNVDGVTAAVDAHAPKVCDLKWLVGDWDTPQKVRKKGKKEMYLCNVL